MQGFKSFAKKVTIDLSTDVTGVVGPNGSGKSNVAEAIRFVLGEQSMKGLRSKSGSDLIFKGSSSLSPLSRASVSIHLNNAEKKINEKLFSKNEDIENTLINFINLDEIILTREIYTDGSSEYLINGTKVRLKDVQELLAMANISAAGHTIVNQGEADRILLSNNNDRREMIEDALGLRIYHMRIKEGEKKLEKVSIHLNEIELLRRENTPHLNFLKKQVKELEKREEEIRSVSSMLKIYLARENSNITEKRKELSTHNVEDKIQNLEKELEEVGDPKRELNVLNKNEEKLSLENSIKNIKEQLYILEKEKETIYTEKINLEVEIKFLKRKEEEILLNTNINVEEIKKDIDSYILDKRDFEAYAGNREKLWSSIFSLYENKKYEELGQNLKDIKGSEDTFWNKLISQNKNEINAFDEKRENNFKEEIASLEEKQRERGEKLRELILKIEDFSKDLSMNTDRLQKINEEEKELSYKIDNKILSIKLELEKLYGERENAKLKENIVQAEEENFENLLREMSIIIGHSAMNYKNFDENNLLEEEKAYTVINQHDLLRKIERSKIKIEESGLINAGDIIDEYKSLSERDSFLEREIVDLNNSKNNLESLIRDLKESLLTDFDMGLQKINFNFNNYFNEIFSGGRASLSLEKKELKIEEASEEEDEDKKREPGIEISVSLPEKKVKDLQMLSGGERALTSIALIFAMSSINHPPFMVLDETDAALDEANARKYGKMIKKLSEKSKLLVITHNRETMNQCDVLYGVTISAEGCSKLLSIRFDEATEFAK
jgi:chromosome segregation protein